MPLISPSGGGGGLAAVAGELVQSGGSILIADGGFALLPLAHQSGPALLNYADPTAPTIVTAGIYAFNFELVCDEGAQAQGTFNAELDLGPALSSTASVQSSFPLDPASAFPAGTPAATWYLSAGDAVQVSAANFVGTAAALHFHMANGNVQRLA